MHGLRLGYLKTVQEEKMIDETDIQRGNGKM